MTDKELTIWEHLDSVMRVLTSKEMGAWLYRRDKRVLVTELEKIREEIMKYSAENKNSEDLYLAGCGDGAYHSLAIVDKHIKELKGKTE